MRKRYISSEEYEAYRNRYLECVRMLNGLERTLERQLPDSTQRWPDPPAGNDSKAKQEPESEPGPRDLNPEPRTLNPEPLSHAQPSGLRNQPLSFAARE